MQAGLEWLVGTVTGNGLKKSRRRTTSSPQDPAMDLTGQSVHSNNNPTYNSIMPANLYDRHLATLREVFHGRDCYAAERKQKTNPTHESCF